MTQIWHKQDPITLGGILEKWTIYSDVDGKRYEAIGYFKRIDGTLVAIYEIKEVQPLVDDYDNDYGCAPEDDRNTEDDE